MVMLKYLNKKNNYKEGGMRSSIFVLVVGIFALSCLADSAEAHRKGQFSVSFDKTDPRGELSIIYTKRHLLKETNKNPPAYNVADVVFEVVVPESYDSKKPAPLFVWISPTDDGKAPASLIDSMARRGVIYIGADNAGNEKNVNLRFRAAIDAVLNMKKLYSIDEKKVIISGSSGGGRCASMLAITYPDVFTFGGMYCIGCNFFDDVLDEQRRRYKGFWEKKNTNLLGIAKKHCYAFITGGKDFNKPDTKRCYDGYKANGFKNCLYHENPELDHNMPHAEDVEAAFSFFDEWLFPKLFADFKAAERSYKAKQYATAAKKLEACKEIFPVAADLWEKIVETADAEVEKAESRTATNPTKLNMQLKAIAVKYGPAARRARELLEQAAEQSQTKQ